MSLRVCTFAGASSLPLVVAEEVGLYAAAGLDVELIQTRSSDELMTGLVDGTYQVVHAAPDNFIAWRDRMGAPIVAWIGGASGPLALVGRPGMRDLSELRGGRIAVDAPTSGFVSILRKLLREAGIDIDGIALDPLGATHLRAAALREGRTDATMLTLPWSAAARRDGFPILADGRAVAPRVQGGSGGSLESWLATAPDTADAYLRAIVAALTWLALPTNHEAAREILARRYAIEPDLAEEVRAAFADPRSGWSPSAFPDPAGMAAVCALRTENGQPPASPPDTYLDLGPYRRVLGSGWVA
jgi:ABC-type nitrate/sulfonate/bicarbonate transport system substrate-binding protein